MSEGPFDIIRMVEVLTVAGVGAGIGLYARSFVAKRNDEVQETEIKRIEVSTAKRIDALEQATERHIAEARADHARELGEVRGVLKSMTDENRTSLKAISDTLVELGKQISNFSVVLIGLDGKNGIRSEVKGLATEQHALHERVMELDFATRRHSDAIEQLQNTEA